MRTVTSVRCAAVAVILAVGLAACSPTEDGGEQTPTSTAPPVLDEPSVLIIQVTDEDGYAVQNVVMGTLPEGEQSTPCLAYVPPSLLVTTADEPAAIVTLGETSLQPDAVVVSAAASATLGIPVDGSVTMDRLAFAGLVDSVGGAWIELSQPEQLPPDAAGVVVTLPAGLVRLDGITAATYVTAPRLNESEDVSMERFSEVWKAVLRRLPVSSERIRALVINLGSLARSTVDSDVFVTALDRARAGMRNRQELEIFVTSDTIRGGARPASVLNAAGSRTVAVMFAPFEPPLKPPAGTLSNSDSLGSESVARSSAGAR